MSYVSITRSAISFLLGTKYLIVRNSLALGCGDDFVEIVHLLNFLFPVPQNRYGCMYILIREKLHGHSGTFWQVML